MFIKCWNEFIQHDSIVECMFLDGKLFVIIVVAKNNLALAYTLGYHCDIIPLLRTPVCNNINEHTRITVQSAMFTNESFTNTKH